MGDFLFIAVALNQKSNTEYTTYRHSDEKGRAISDPDLEVPPNYEI